MTSQRFLVSGRVQGVGFRWWVSSRAKELDLGGWVRNLPDGRVEVLAGGSEAGLAALEMALQHGPRFARVENVDKCEIMDEQVDYKSFDII